ncbi:MAG: copper resistance protein NlpE [Flavobacteriales bacterium]|nr:copper resistance protein NlpE [Flavobacteriales bacterium]
MKLRLVFILSLALFFNSCGNEAVQDMSSEVSKETTFENVDPIPDAVNKFDWKGTYAGVLPCSDCDELEAEVTLENKIYSRKLIYRGKSNTPVLSQGLYEWNEEGSELTLKSFKGNNQVYRVIENQLVFVDSEGVAGEFRLKKVKEDEAV